MHGSGQRGSVASREDSGRICYTFIMLKSDKDITAGTIWLIDGYGPHGSMSLRFGLLSFFLTDHTRRVRTT
jgi:hypothetical protein